MFFRPAATMTCSLMMLACGSYTIKLQINGCLQTNWLGILGELKEQIW